MQLNNKLIGAGRATRAAPTVRGNQRRSALPDALEFYGADPMTVPVPLSNEQTSTVVQAVAAPAMGAAACTTFQAIVAAINQHHITPQLLANAMLSGAMAGALRDCINNIANTVVAHKCVGWREDWQTTVKVSVATAINTAIGAPAELAQSAESNQPLAQVMGLLTAKNIPSAALASSFREKLNAVMAHLTGQNMPYATAIATLLRLPPTMLLQGAPFTPEGVCSTLALQYLSLHLWTEAMKAADTLVAQIQRNQPTTS